MTESTGDPAPNQPDPSAPRVPGERRLPHPPSDRYRTPEPETEAPAPGSPVRGLAFGLLAGTVGAVSIVVLGGVLAVSAGLVVVAAVTGWAVAIGLRTGGRAAIGPGTRVAVALLMATLAVTGGQLGLWWFASSEGGVLGLTDYLGQTFGVLVPLEFALAWIVSGVTAR